jgi:TRAP-type uncharacterized transport system fused permease subunit
MSNDAAPGSTEFEDMKRYDPEFRFRQVTGIAAIIVTILACSLSVFHIYTAGFGMLMDMKHRAVHLTVVMVLIFLLYPSRKDDRTRRRDIAGDVITALIGAVILAFGLGNILHLHFLLTVLVFTVGFGFIAYTRRVKFYRQAGIPYVDIALAVLGASISVYIFVSYEQIVGRAGLPTTLDLIFGLLAILLVMEAARRAIGWDLPVLALLCLIYAYFGPYMPGFLAHRGYSVKRTIEHMYLGTEGIYGIPLGVVATYVFHFVLFGIFVAKTGLGQLFIDIAMAIAGRSTGGPAKVAIISSGLLGSINGSSIANTVTTGSFTIPLMKRMGYSPRFAGAVEATASTGGQITPPIMGAAAFIMAEMIGMRYIKIAAAATIPAILHYLGIGVMVHLQAAKDGLRGLPKEELPDIKRCLMVIYSHLPPGNRTQSIPCGFLGHYLIDTGQLSAQGDAPQPESDQRRSGVGRAQCPIHRCCVCLRGIYRRNSHSDRIGVELREHDRQLRSCHGRIPVTFGFPEYRVTGSW